MARPEEAEVEIVCASVEVGPRVVSVEAAVEVRVRWKRFFLSLFLSLEVGEEASMILFSHLACIRPLVLLFVVSASCPGLPVLYQFSKEIFLESFVKVAFQKTQKQLLPLLLKWRKSRVGVKSAVSEGRCSLHQIEVWAFGSKIAPESMN
jgi:hypothetical protein